MRPRFSRALPKLLSDHSVPVAYRASRVIPIERPGINDSGWIFVPKFDDFRGLPYLDGTDATFYGNERAASRSARVPLTILAVWAA